MTRSMKIGLAICAAVLSGCAAPKFASEMALKVQVQRQYSTMLDKCMKLEPLMVREELGPMGWTQSPMEIAVKNAENKIRELVATAGGDTVVFTTMDLVQPNQTGASKVGVQVQALGFRCKS